MEMPAPAAGRVGLLKTGDGVRVIQPPSASGGRINPGLFGDDAAGAQEALNADDSELERILNGN
jgi:hypothetical protein